MNGRAVFAGCAAFLVLAARAAAQGLSLGEESTRSVVEVGSRYPHASLATGVFLLYVVLGTALLAWLIFKKRRPWNPPIPLTDWPDSAKTIATMVLVAYGLVHVFALLEVYLQSRVVFSSAVEYFSYMKLAKLVATSHAHLFGHSTMYAVTSVVFLFSSVSERLKVTLIGVALAGGLLDVPTWWMIKYAGGGFEAVAALAAVMTAGGWTLMAGRIIYELWLRRRQA